MVTLLSADDLKAKGIRLSKSQRNLLIKKGDFPKPVKIGARLVAWPEHEINDWLKIRIAERDGAVQ
ncbi:AlpA family phage regulatory protein [Agrobacterium fabrum]|nr:AlpA family phage regulatory protein [Agrobacterium fabrum]